MNQDSLSFRVETLESRLSLSLGDGMQELYYPEGFVHAAIFETVNLFNPGMLTVQYELWVRYETGQRDQVIRTGSVAPGEFEGILIADPAAPQNTAVRSDEAFSFVLRSTGQLTATLQHDDFGGSAVASFVAFGSSSWSLPGVSKWTGNNDFIVLYNPSDSPVTIQAQFFNDSGLAFQITATVDGLRRGGWNINQLAGLPSGEFGVRIESSRDVIVAHSQYNKAQRIASLTLGTFDRGALAGALLAPDLNRPTPGNINVRTEVTAFNPGNADANVTFHFIVRDGGAPVNPIDVSIPSHERYSFSYHQLGLSGRDLSIVWESDNRVSVAAFSRSVHSRFVVTPSARVAATQWQFGAAFVDRVNASIMDTEDVLAFNPTAQDVDVTFTYTFRNGATAMQTITIGAFEIGASDVFMPVQHIGAGHPFTVRLDATGPIVASLETWNHRRISGRYPTVGVPGGTVSPLSDVLVIPSR